MNYKLTLRQVTHPRATTKGSVLSFRELDENFLFLLELIGDSSSSNQIYEKNGPSGARMIGTTNAIDGERSAVIAGQGNLIFANDASILGGVDNRIVLGANNSVIAGCTGIVATQPNTLYACNIIANGDVTLGGTIINESILVQILDTVNNLPDIISEITENITNIFSLLDLQDIITIGGTYEDRVLKFVRSDGTEFIVDLTRLFTDIGSDNDIYVESGIFDPTTGNITFLRTDGTTFDVDISACCGQGGEATDISDITDIITNVLNGVPDPSILQDLINRLAELVTSILDTLVNTIPDNSILDPIVRLLAESINQIIGLVQDIIGSTSPGAIPIPGVPNPDPDTPNPDPDTPNPDPDTPNPDPDTPNPHIPIDSVIDIIELFITQTLPGITDIIDLGMFVGVVDILNDIITILGSGNVDNHVVSGVYDSVNEDIILTLNDGSTVNIDVNELVREDDDVFTFEADYIGNNIVEFARTDGSTYTLDLTEFKEMIEDNTTSDDFFTITSEYVGNNLVRFTRNNPENDTYDLDLTDFRNEILDEINSNTGTTTEDIDALVLIDEFTDVFVPNTNLYNNTLLNVESIALLNGDNNIINNVDNSTIVGGHNEVSDVSYSFINSNDSKLSSITGSFVNTIGVEAEAAVLNSSNLTTNIGMLSGDITDSVVNTVRTIIDTSNGISSSIIQGSACNINTSGSEMVIIGNNNTLENLLGESGRTTLLGSINTISGNSSNNLILGYSNSLTNAINNIVSGSGNNIDVNNGSFNIINSVFSALSGNSDNTSMLGGMSNSVSNSINSLISGGYNNKSFTSSGYIGSNIDNITIIGGHDNMVEGTSFAETASFDSKDAIIIGGHDNIMQNPALNSIFSSVGSSISNVSLTQLSRIITQLTNSGLNEELINVISVLLQDSINGVDTLNRFIDAARTSIQNATPELNVDIIQQTIDEITITVEETSDSVLGIVVDNLLDVVEVVLQIPGNLLTALLGNPELQRIIEQISLPTQEDIDTIVMIINGMSPEISPEELQLILDQLPTVTQEELTSRIDAIREELPSLSTDEVQVIIDTIITQLNIPTREELQGIIDGFLEDLPTLSVEDITNIYNSILEVLPQTSEIEEFVAQTNQMILDELGGVDPNVLRGLITDLVTQAPIPTQQEIIDVINSTFTDLFASTIEQIINNFPLPTREDIQAAIDSVVNQIVTINTDTVQEIAGIVQNMIPNQQVIDSAIEEILVQLPDIDRNLLEDVINQINTGSFSDLQTLISNPPFVDSIDINQTRELFENIIATFPTTDEVVTQITDSFPGLSPEDIQVIIDGLPVSSTEVIQGTIDGLLEDVIIGVDGIETLVNQIGLDGLINNIFTLSTDDIPQLSPEDIRELITQFDLDIDASEIIGNTEVFFVTLINELAPQELILEAETIVTELRSVDARAFITVLRTITDGSITPEQFINSVRALDTSFASNSTPQQSFAVEDDINDILFRITESLAGTPIFAEALTSGNDALVSLLSLVPEELAAERITEIVIGNLPEDLTLGEDVIVLIEDLLTQLLEVINSVGDPQELIAELAFTLNQLGSNANAVLEELITLLLGNIAPNLTSVVIGLINQILGVTSSDTLNIILLAISETLEGVNQVDTVTTLTVEQVNIILKVVNDVINTDEITENIIETNNSGIYNQVGSIIESSNNSLLLVGGNNKISNSTNSAIMMSSNSEINGKTNTIILGCNDIVAEKDDTLYTSNIIAKSVCILDESGEEICLNGESVTGMTDTHVESGELISGSTLELVYNTGGSIFVDLSELEDHFIVSGELQSTDLVLNNSNGDEVIIDLSDFSPSDDRYVTGGTLNSGTIVFTDSTGETFDVDISECCNDGGAGEIIDITNAELNTAINDNTLSKGSYYAVTDYNDGSEKIVVFANETNNVTSHASSNLNSDIIHYRVSDNTITHREDEAGDLKTNFDFRIDNFNLRPGSILNEKSGKIRLSTSVVNGTNSFILPIKSGSIIEGGFLKGVLVGGENITMQTSSGSIIYQDTVSKFNSCPTKLDLLTNPTNEDNETLEIIIDSVSGVIDIELNYTNFNF